MDKAGLREWHNLTDQTKRNIFRETSAATGLPEAAIEKDWWVVRTIDLMFTSSIVEVPAINKHLGNIYDSGELDRKATISILETVQQEGSRRVKRNVEF